MKFFVKGLLFAFIASSSAFAFEIQGACSKGESVRDSLWPRYSDWLSKKIPQAQGFSEALFIRRKSDNALEKTFAEYWISRTFYEFGYEQLAHQGFEQLLSATATTETSTVRVAALQCILQIEKKWPALEFHPLNMAEIEKVPELAVYLKIKNQKLQIPSSSNKSLNQILVGLDALASKKYKVALDSIEPLLIEKNALIEPYREDFVLLMARANFAVGEFAHARKWYSQIARNSNRLVSSVSEAGWAAIREENYPAAIGSAVSLQTGGLRRSFAPEAHMIMAMAFNELCQYPDSMRATQVFRKNYVPVQEWLEKASGEIYPQVVGYLKKKSNLPDPVGTELIKNPLFVSMQSEINHFSELKKNLETNQTLMRLEQKRKALALLKDLHELQKQYEESNGEWTVKTIKEKLAPFKDQLVQYRAMRQAEPVWRKILASHMAKMPERKEGLKKQVEKEFAFQVRKMRDQLDQVFENTRLVEIEILTGASEDLVWRNAHPEYQQALEGLKSAESGRSVASEWNWGKLSLDSNSNQEIWEDELGNFEADSTNHCDSKDKYMALEFSRKGQ